MNLLMFVARFLLKHYQTDFKVVCIFFSTIQLIKLFAEIEQGTSIGSSLKTKIDWILQKLRLASTGMNSWSSSVYNFSISIWTYLLNCKPTLCSKHFPISKFKDVQLFPHKSSSDRV
jgi:hypothetical protein